MGDRKFSFKRVNQTQGDNFEKKKQIFYSFLLRGLYVRWIIKNKYSCATLIFLFFLFFFWMNLIFIFRPSSYSYHIRRYIVAEKLISYLFTMSPRHLVLIFSFDAMFDVYASGLVTF